MNNIYSLYWGVGEWESVVTYCLESTCFPTNKEIIFINNGHTAFVFSTGIQMLTSSQFHRNLNETNFQWSCANVHERLTESIFIV